MAAANAKRDVGVRGEDLAVAHLEKAGLEILARNWRCKIGEVDIVAVESNGANRTLVFCEVKCRSGLGFGAPLESITHAKLQRLRRLAAQWIITEGVHAHDIRLDAIGIVLLPGREPDINYVKSIG